VQSPLKASDQNVYAVAQGAVSVGRTSGKTVHSTVGTVSGGALIEKDILQDNFTNRKMYRLTLHNPDITTAVRIAQSVNIDLGGKYATAIDPATVDVVVPFSYEGKGVELLATIESLNVEPDQKAKVVVNEKTGTVIIGENVRISTVAISHGDINLKVGPKPAPIATAPVAETTAPPAVTPLPPSIEGAPPENVPMRAPAALAEASGKKENVKLLQESVSVGELVQSLNQMGVSPKDLIVILQNIKASGALQGELEIL
jgi:flagellar P-ring protein precursor FlgI